MTELIPSGPIGVFDSGDGGLTVFKEILSELPDYDYIYLGDNARAPYGTRSLKTVYRFTKQGVDFLFDQGCHLVILACNTASANALRGIQQKDLSDIGEHKRVLGVIRPTTERLSDLTDSGHLGIFATEATVESNSYVIEASKYAPNVKVSQQACPMWVPIIENDEQDTVAADYFTKKYIDQLLEKDPEIDTVLLACTHYPLLHDTIRRFLPYEIDLVSQGALVARSLREYLDRHVWMKEHSSKGGMQRFLTTDVAEEFDTKASKFFGHSVCSEQVKIDG
jgi:glutamate racemase